MIGKVAHSSWLAVTVGFLGLFGRPAAAYTIDSQIYSEGLAVSYTEIDFYDVYVYGAFYAYVDATLSFNGDVYAEDDDWDSSYAVVTLYNDAGPGSYVVEGDHWIWYYDGFVDVGQTYDEFDDGGGDDCCGDGFEGPECEESVYIGADDGGGFYTGLFYAELGSGGEVDCIQAGDGTYSGMVTENIVDIDSTCSDANGNYLELHIDDNDYWPIDAYGNTYANSGYPDKIQFDQDNVDSFQMLIQNDMVPYGSCWIWEGSQGMSYNSAGAPYQTNAVGISLDGVHGTAYRGVYGAGSIYEEE